MSKKKFSSALILDKVSDIISKKLNIEKNTIELKSNLRNDLGGDSLDLIEVSMGIEKEFDIDLEKEKADRVELDNANTVGDLVNLIDRMVNS